MIGSKKGFEKLRVGVLMGGKSIEREVSFNSGRTVCDHLDSNKYIVVPIFQTEHGDLFILPWHFLHRGKITDFRARLETEAQRIRFDELKKYIDFMYIALHGRYGEDGTIQGVLEVLNIPYLGSKVFASAIGMDKAVQKEVLKNNGVDVARGIVIQPNELEALDEKILQERLEKENIKQPYLVKPAHEGSSLGITVVSTLQELITAIKAAAQIDARRKQSVLIEEKLEGLEFVCVCLQKIHRINDKVTDEWFAFPLTEVVPESTSAFYDYEQKYMPGRAIKITPARCSQTDSQRIIDACIKATEVLDFATISRIDGFLTNDGRVVLIDPNSLTGMAPATFIFHQAAEYGMSHTQMINFLIENELKRYGLLNDEMLHLLAEEKRMAGRQEKIRVAVLLGGDSSEREISLESGRNICYKLSPDKYDVIPLFLNDEMELYKLSQKLLIKNATRSIADLVTPDIRVEWSQLPSICDFVFIGLHGGKGENGAVQGMLEMLELPYNGSGVLASSLCMDKYRTNNFLRSKGFDVPMSLLVDKTVWQAMDEQTKLDHVTSHLGNIGFPVIVKPHDDGCSTLVAKAQSFQELVSKINEFFDSSKKTVMIEEFIHAMELTCGVIGNDTVVALPPTKVVAKQEILSILEKFLPGEGENLTPAPLPSLAIALVQDVMCKAYRAVGCKGYARIDCFYQSAEQSPTGKERVIILEFNTLPGMTPATCIFHQAAEIGIKPMEFIDRIVELGLQLHKQRSMVEQQVQASILAPAQSSGEPLLETDLSCDEVCQMIVEEISAEAAENTEGASKLQAQAVIQNEAPSIKVAPDEFIIKMF